MEQHHSPSAVRSGYLSTLRQTFSALIGEDMTSSEKAVNAFMENNCYWQWDYTSSREDAAALEHDEINTHYYPLNIQGNKVVPATIIKKLIALRKKHKK